MNDKSFDKELAKLWNQGGWTKADLGRHFHVSPRTIGRHLDRIVIGDDDILLEDWDDYLGDEDVGRDADADSADTAPQFTYAWVSHGSSTIICRISLADGQAESVRVYDFRDGESPESAFNRSYFGYEQMVVGVVTADFSTGKVMFTSGADGKQYSLPQDLIESIVQSHNTKGGNKSGVQRLMEFANRLANNPSPKVFKRLFSYLTGNGIEIQNDGTVLCYKRVRDDYMDIHSGTFRNAPGDRPTMPRSQVDDDDSVACSKGLHVCSLDYLPTYGSGRSNRIVAVQVDPADFVSLPADNEAKARVCRYLVVADLSRQFKFIHHEEEESV